MHHPDPERHRFLFRVGLILVVVSFPVHYLGLIVFGIMAAVYDDRGWLWGAVWAYALSWVVMGVGFWLGGRPAYEYAKQFWHLRKRRKRYLHLRRIRASRRQVNSQSSEPT